MLAGGLPLQVWKGRKRRMTRLLGRDGRVLGSFSVRVLQSPTQALPAEDCLQDHPLDPLPLGLCSSLLPCCSAVCNIAVCSAWLSWRFSSSIHKHDQVSVSLYLAITAGVHNTLTEKPKLFFLCV